MQNTSNAHTTTWNSNDDFLNDYLSLKSNLRTSRSSYEDIRRLRSKEFHNTIDIVRQGWYTTENGDKVYLPDDKEMRENTVFYTNQLSPSSKTIPIQTIIKVVNKDCLEVAQALIMLDFNPAVLNMASRRNPGGGVMNGAGAQEETLFRRTNLFRSLYQFSPYAEEFKLKRSRWQYPLDSNFGGIYTPDAILFREGEEKGYRLMEQPVKMSFISVAGMNRPELTPDYSEIAPHLVEGIKNKMRTILAIGLQHSHDSLVLGALGCGAFCNPPGHVARLFKEVLDEPEFKNKFRIIIFAIIDDHNTRQRHNPHGNYLPFKEAFPS